MSRKRKILVTAALPYANGPLHFGHIAGAYLPADCYARFERLMGNDVLYICGSDEHGVAITLSAEQAGRSPEAHVELHHEMLKKSFEQFNIFFDHYSRTTWEGHIEPSQTFFQDLLKNGYIEKKVTDQLYSPDDHRFLADRYVIGTCPKCGCPEGRGDECLKCGASYEATDLKDPRSKLTGAKLILKATTHWFLRFDLFKKELKEWIGKKGWKGNVLCFAQNYIDDLKPRAITRDSNWGIQVPLEGAEGKVLYVWFEAPIGYISATKEWAEKVKKAPEAWKEYWFDPETKLVQFIGKDNIPFHAIFFPAMTMGQDQPYKLVDELPANEFYNLEGKQFSKSEGWFIDLDDFFQKFCADQIRYAIASNAPETQDSEFSWKGFQMRCNSDLLGKYGNLVNRVLVFVEHNCGGLVPPLGDLTKEDERFLEQVKVLTEECRNAYAHFSLRKATQAVMELASLGNGYFEAKKPWQGVRDPALGPKMLTTIACALEGLNALALVSYPLIPTSAQRVWGFLGHNAPLSSHTWEEVLDKGLSEVKALPEPEVLFQKIEDDMIEAELDTLKKQVCKVEESSFPPFKEEVGFDQVQALDLRVVQILSAEKIPKSKKLLKLEVDVGFEKRTIVSGIAEGYLDPEVLVGKKGVIVANLKPVKLMGIKSQGMLLTAGEKAPFEIPEIRDLPPGSCVS